MNPRSAYLALSLLWLGPTAGCNTTAPPASEGERAPSTASAAQAPTKRESASGLVVGLDGITLNGTRLSTAPTVGEIVAILGKPDRIVELVNTAHTYDTLGAYVLAKADRVLGLHFHFRMARGALAARMRPGDGPFPMRLYAGVLELGGMKVDPGTDLTAMLRSGSKLPWQVDPIDATTIKARLTNASIHFQDALGTVDVTYH
jgi:hypothetical protein